MTRKTQQNTLPEWAQRISSLRERLRMSQAELGRRFECSAMTVSRWERGLLAPSSDYYIQLGNLSGKSECWYFWERAGLQLPDVLRALPARVRPKLPVSALPALEGAHAGTAERSKDPKRGGLVAIPLLNVVAGSHGNQGDKKLSLDHIPARRVMGAPAEWCPNPDYTSLVRVKGDSMQPMMHDGDIMAVDSSQIDREQLNGKVVIVSNEEKGLCVSRLRRYQTVDVLEPENRDYQAIVFSKNEGWRIVGRVLWWITEAP
jgi:DNA-binding XRE family transcriptional regulator